MATDFTPSTDALEDALNAIAEIIDESESDGAMMSNQLGRIVEAANGGLRVYMAAYMEMQKAELAYLKAMSA